MNQLISAILLQAVKDLQHKKFRSEAQKFFQSDWFDDLAEELGVDPMSIRKQVATDSYEKKLKSYSAYH